MRRMEIEAVLAKRVEAWRRRDSVTLAAGHSEDAVLDTMIAGRIEGRPAIEALYRDWFTAFPEMEFEVEDQVIDGDHVALFWSQRGKHLGDFCGLKATGRSYEMRGVFLMTFKDGKIVHVRSIYDFTGLLVQLGVLKAKPAF